MGIIATPCCCPDNEVILHLIPCEGEASCSKEIFGPAALWASKIGKGVSVGEVYKVSLDSDLNAPYDPDCFYCGTISASSVGGTALNLEVFDVFNATSFEKVADCDDVRCPNPILYFQPCNDQTGQKKNTTCENYPLVATKSIWDSLLGITIDYSNPSSYAGTWLYKRTDGDSCCDGTENCFSFCGTLDPIGPSAICYDSSNANTTPQCEKCNVVGKGAAQFIGCSTCNSVSSGNFTRITSNPTTCQNNLCQKCRPQNCQKATGSGDTKLRYRGKKTLTFDNWNLKTEREFCQFVPGFREVVQDSELKFNLQIVIDYSVYLQGNAVQLGDSGADDWVISKHTKDPCIVIDDVNIVEQEFSYENEYVSKKRQDGTCSGSTVINISKGRDVILNSSSNFKLRDQGASGNQNDPPLIKQARYEKRRGLRVDAAGGKLYPDCDYIVSQDGFPERICPDLDATDDSNCIMNYMTCANELQIDYAFTFTSTFCDENASSCTLGDPQSTVFNSENVGSDPIRIPISTALMMQDALDMCCCTDTMEKPILYFTDFPRVVNSLETVFNQIPTGEADVFNSGTDKDFFGQFKTVDGEIQYRKLFENNTENGDWGFGRKVFIGSAFGITAWLDPELKTVPVNEQDKREYNCTDILGGQIEPEWRFELTGEAVGPTTIPFINDFSTGSPGNNIRTLNMDFSIVETFVSLECISDSNVPGSNCADGVLDVSELP